jgi:hypothetical protein
MSNAHYGEAIELIRHGSQHDGVSLSYFQCRDLLHAIEDGQNNMLTAQDLTDILTSEVHQLRYKIRQEEEGIISMGNELDRLERVEKLCGLLYDKMETWGYDIEEMVEDYGLQDELDAYHKVGGWDDA